MPKRKQKTQLTYPVLEWRGHQYSPTKIIDANGNEITTFEVKDCVFYPGSEKATNKHKKEVEKLCQLRENQTSFNMK